MWKNMIELEKQPGKIHQWMKPLKERPEGTMALQGSSESLIRQRNCKGNNPTHMPPEGKHAKPSSSVLTKS